MPLGNISCTVAIYVCLYRFRCWFWSRSIDHGFWISCVYSCGAKYRVPIVWFHKSTICMIVVVQFIVVIIWMYFDVLSFVNTDHRNGKVVRLAVLLVFNVASEYQGCHPDDHSVSVMAHWYFLVDVWLRYLKGRYIDVCTEWLEILLTKCSRTIFSDEPVFISITIPIKIVPSVPVDKTSVFVHDMAWHQGGDKPLPEAILTQLIGNWMKLQRVFFSMRFKIFLASVLFSVCSWGKYWNLCRVTVCDWNIRMV